MTRLVSTPRLKPRVAPALKPIVPDRRLAMLTLAALVVGIGWRVGRYLLQFPIWGDEAYIGMNFLDRDFWGMTKKLDYGQVAPVVFLWIEWAMCRCFGPSELALRFFPLLAGAAGLLLFWRFCKLTLPPRAGSLAVCLLAVSYYPVRHAAEVKPYSFDLLAVMLLLLPTVHWLNSPARAGWLIVLTLITPLALGSSYPAIFVAGACSLVLLPRVWKAGFGPVWGWFIAYNLAMVATFVAHMLLVGREQLDAQAGTTYDILHRYWQDWFPPANWLEWPLWLVKAHTGYMLAYPVGGSHGASALTLVLCLVGSWSVWRMSLRKEPGYFTEEPGLTGRRLAILCLAPFGLSMVAAFLHRYPYGGSARLAQHLAPAICILAGCGIGQLIAWVPRKPGSVNWTVVVMFGLIAIGLAGLLRDAYKPYKMEGDRRIRQLFEEISSKSQPGDAIVAFENRDSLRTNMVWYMRQTRLPISYRDHPDWPALDTNRHTLWAVSVRFEDGHRLTPAEMLADSRADWEASEHLERVFPADSKDVPLQFCDVYRWTRK